MDILGNALLDYQNGNYTEDIITESTISEEDVMPLPYMFRSYDEMPALEQKALQLAKGKTLDVGCGAGSHALFLQEEKQLEVTAIDISPGAAKVTQARGVSKVLCQNVYDVTETYDTILLLMNGIGICGKLNNMHQFLSHLKKMMNPGGQILVDSSDIIYMFDQEEDGGIWVDASNYYGEVTFNMSYKGKTSATFDWLYLDFNTLANACAANGLQCELIQEGEHYDFLARLTQA